MIGLYNAALLPLRPLVGLWATWDARRPGRRREWDERCGSVFPEVAPGAVWLHGASVGEARLLSSLADRLRTDHPRRALLASAVTRTGRSQLPSPPKIDAAFFAPLDFRGPVRRLLDRVKPSLLVLIETELWPNLLDEASRRGIAVVIVNARLSPRRMDRYLSLSRLYRPVLGTVQRIGAQSEADAQRFVKLGVDPERVAVTGNLKFDLPLPTGDPNAMRRSLGLAEGRPVLVAGSTGQGEEPLILRAFAQARRSFPDLFLVLAPRHPERARAEMERARAAGLAVTPLSSADPTAGKGDVLLVDQVGALASLYRLARLAFVGGSLVPVGGHNLLEPAAVGVPVLFGPHTEHVTELAEILLSSHGGRRVSDSEELAAALVELLDDPGASAAMGRAARDVVDSNRGALDRTAALIEQALAAP